MSATPGATETTEFRVADDNVEYTDNWSELRVLDDELETEG
jgi:hypothetical protein